MAQSLLQPKDHEAYQVLVKGLLHDNLATAKSHPVVGPILAKLSDDDISTLKSMAVAAQIQQGTVHDS